MEENKNVRVRCTINYEEMENGFCNYHFAVPMEDLTEGYMLGQDTAFECSIEGDLKVINVIMLNAFRIAEVEFPMGEDGEKKPTECLVCLFVGMKPMTPEEWEKFSEEERARREEFEKQQAEAQVEAEADDGVEDIEFIEEEGGQMVLDLTGK